MALPSSSPAGEWDACGDRYYAKQHLYRMAWPPVHLEQMRVACAPYGGPIATVRDERQILLVTGAATRPVVRIFTAAGYPTAAFVWDRGRLAGMGWTAEEELVIVEERGDVSVYGMHSTAPLRRFSMGSAVAADGIERCVVHAEGVVALTAGSLQLWAVDDLEAPKPERLADPRLDAPPHCMAVHEPRHTLSGCVEVLLAVRDSVVVVDADSAHDQRLAHGSAIEHLEVAPNGQFLAGFTQDGRLMVWLSDFTKTLSEFATKADSPPRQIAWCGTDSVLLYWQDGLLLMVGPFGDWVKYQLEESAVLVSEPDGARIVGDTAHEMLRRVPDAAVEVFQIGSTAPGALLYDARNMFDRRDARADEVLRGIVGSLPEAVGTCVDAAAAEIVPARQIALIKAACYGRAFLGPEEFPRDRIVGVCRDLRILNALRQPGVGVPLTHAQLSALTRPVLVARLANARRHLLALRIAEALGLPAEKVLVHWACAKITAGGEVPDAQLMEQILGRLRNQPSIRYATIAAHAQEAGRKALAAMLLDHEPTAALQVPPLLALGEERRALAAATESGDPDLVYHALFHSYRSTPLSQFLSAISARPLAKALFVAYCSREEPEVLEQVWLSQGHSEGVAAMALLRAVRRSLDVDAQRAATGGKASEAALLEVLKLLDRAAELFGQSKDHGFQARSCTEFARLRRVQTELEADTGNACFLGLSVADTIRQAVRLGNHRAAQRVRSDFRVTDRRFWWLKMRTLAGMRDWEGLEAFARDKKSPIGYEPFISASKENDAPPPVTARFVARLGEGKRKAEEYAAIGMFQEAAEAAAQSRDSAMLTQIQAVVGAASPLGQAVAQLKDRLQAAGQR